MLSFTTTIGIDFKIHTIELDGKRVKLLTLCTCTPKHPHMARQHASEGVNKILIGNKADWTDKHAVPEELGRDLAHELGIKFMETSAKLNKGVEEAFFTLARLVTFVPPHHLLSCCMRQRLQGPIHRLANRGSRGFWWCDEHRWIRQGQPAHIILGANMLYMNLAPLFSYLL